MIEGILALHTLSGLYVSVIGALVFKGVVLLEAFYLGLYPGYCKD